jgi:hypothetical protein
MNTDSKNIETKQCTIVSVMCSGFNKFFRRLFVIAIFPILFIISVIAMILALPFWLFTGKGILNPICDGMLLEVLDFLKD